MIFHMVRTSEIQPWLEVGWDYWGASHLRGWCILQWTAPDTAVAPFSSYLAEYQPPRETNEPK